MILPPAACRLPPAAADQAVTRNVPCTRCQADSRALIRASPPIRHRDCGLRRGTTEPNVTQKLTEEFS
jgi:hypothetical protein